MELEFVKTLGVLNETFYECIEFFNSRYGHIITSYRDGFIRIRDVLYADEIKMVHPTTVVPGLLTEHTFLLPGQRRSA